MFSDQEIRAAMTELVKEKGENHTSFGRYANPETGKGACFLGALCEHMGLAIPTEGTPAKSVMGTAPSERMKTAFSLAQYLNDQHIEWKYVLMGVDEVLAGNYAETKLGCPCGCAVNANFQGIVDKIRARRALDKAEAPRHPFYASGGIITIDDLPLGSFSTAMGSITFNVASATSGMSAFSKVFLNEGVAVKKDHALVA